MFNKTGLYNSTIGIILISNIGNYYTTYYKFNRIYGMDDYISFRDSILERDNESNPESIVNFDYIVPPLMGNIIDIIDIDDYLFPSNSSISGSYLNFFNINLFA